MEARVTSKSTIRAQVSAARQRLGASERTASAQAIAARLTALAEYQQARCVGLYAATPDEVATDLICDHALRARKQVCYPRVSNPAQCQMDFFAVRSRDELTPGFHNILEPQPGSTPVSPHDIDCICVPGVAFDRHGHRLGQGAGYYDRWLAGYTGERVGLAYECQVVDELPTNTQDQHVQYVVTEQRVLTTK